MKRLLPVFLCLGLVGCATPTNKYANDYNQAVATGQSVVINREGDFETIQDEITRDLSAVGYSKILFASPNEGFMVLAKDPGFGSALLVGNAHMYKVILKYTNAGQGKTRIDLVNGSTEIYTKDEIDRDIQKLAALIRS